MAGNNHPVDILFAELDRSFANYQLKHVIAVPRLASSRIRYTAFFPGGDGLWKEPPEWQRPDLPVGGIMVLGQDFGNWDDFEKSRDRKQISLVGYNEDNKTWVGLNIILDRAEIPKFKCFFTNIYIGLREGSCKPTGRFPVPKNHNFFETCHVFFDFQVNVLKPKLILCLGSTPIQFLSRHVCGQPDWPQTATLSERVRNREIITDMKFMTCPAVTTVVVPLFHPCLWKANLGRAFKGEADCQENDIQRIKDAVRISKVLLT